MNCACVVYLVWCGVVRWRGAGGGVQGVCWPLSAWSSGKPAGTYHHNLVVQIPMLTPHSGANCPAWQHLPLSFSCSRLAATFSPWSIWAKLKPSWSCNMPCTSSWFGFGRASAELLGLGTYGARFVLLQQHVSGTLIFSEP